MYGRTIIVPLQGLDAFPQAMPNQANRYPESPIVGSVTIIGSNDAQKAITRGAITYSLPRMLHNTNRFTTKWKTFAWQNE